MSENLSIHEIRFCLRCGSPLASRLRAGKMRPACPACGWTYFPDPKVAVAVVVIAQGKVLLVQRANPPQQGRWAFPGGFLDAGEDPQEAATRECLEETGLQVRITALLDASGRPQTALGAHLILTYRAEVSGGTLQARDDAAKAAFFAPDALPDLAFEQPDTLRGYLT
ncbi:MAG: hypothetical protein Fur0018_04720 [Anaerolineales bacterium]